VASAIAAGGLDALGTLGYLSVGTALLGVLLVFSAAFLADGSYILTTVTTGIGTTRLSRGFDPRYDRSRYRRELVGDYLDEIAFAKRELESNERNLERAIVALLTGSTLLITAGILSIITSSYELSPVQSPLGLFLLLLLPLAGVGLMYRLL